ncbi:hypothetical protein AgCh_019189 [Apium graveolens]
MTRSLIELFNKSGIETGKVMKFLSETKGGVENLGFSNQDVRNVIRDIRRRVFDSGDAECGLLLLRELQENSFGNFFYRVDVDDENRVRGLVWVDPRSMNAYKNFGDVVTFDSTYRTNRDETEASYKWVLRTWLEAVDNKPPRTIITDQDIALGNAIAESLTPTEFEGKWEHLVEKYDLEDYAWLNDMYAIRTQWIGAYTKQHFSAGMTTTSRNESTNSFFDEYVQSSTGLKEFIENSQKALETQYLKEDKMGFNPLFTILKDNKLTGPNYIEWKRNLDIVLTAEEYKFCTYEPKPEQPAADAPEDEKEYYKRWIKADEMSRCYILAAMSGVLQHQH